MVIASADSIHQDIARVCDLGGAAEALPSNSTVILKDNITWHKPFLSANTTPWQLEGSVKWLQDNNRQMVAVHNDTVVTDPHEGLINLKLQPVYDKYNIEQFFVNNPESVKWNKWRPQGEIPWLDKVYPDTCLHHHHWRGEKQFRRAAQHSPSLLPHSHSWGSGRLNRRAKRIAQRHVCDCRWHLGR